MDSKAAVHAIILSAAHMGGIYAWRWLTGRGNLPATAKLSAAKLIGYGPQVSPEGFLVAWGIVYGGLALTSTILPGMAGSLALLILLTGAIANFGSASETALGLVKLKTGTTHAGPEPEGGATVGNSSLESSTGLPPGATAGLEGGFSGNVVPFTTNTKGEHVPSGLAPAPSKIRLPKRPSEREILALNHKYQQKNVHIPRKMLERLARGEVHIRTLEHAIAHLPWAPGQS